MAMNTEETAVSILPKPIISAIKRVIAPRNSLAPRSKAAQCLLPPSVSPRRPQFPVPARPNVPTPSQAASLRKTDNAATCTSRVSNFNTLTVYTAMLVLMGVFCAAYSTRHLGMQISAQLVDALIPVTPECGPMRAMKDFEALQARKVVVDFLLGRNGNFEFMRMVNVVLCSVGTFMLCIMLYGGCVVLCCVNFVILLVLGGLVIAKSVRHLGVNRSLDWVGGVPSRPQSSLLQGV